MTGIARPMDIQRLLGLAYEALAKSQAQSMLPELERASRQAAGNYRVWHTLGLAYRQVDSRELAIPALQRASSLAPGNAEVSHALARTLFEAGLPSVEAYGRALQLSPGNTTIIVGMTSALVAENRCDQAIEGLQQIVGRSPLWVEGQKLLSDLRWLEGERIGFTSNFDDALRQHPKDFGLRREQILSLLHAEHWDRLLELCDEGRSAIGDHQLFDINEAVCYTETGRLNDGDRLFDKLKESPDSTVQIRYVRHQLRAGRPEVASRHLEPWLRHPDARNFWPYASIAWRMTRDSRWEWLEGDERFVGVYDIADTLPPLDQLGEALRNLHTTRGQPLVQSVRGGTQTDGNLFQNINPVIVALREAVRKAVAAHVAQLPPHDPDHPLLGPRRSPIGFSGAWSVWLRSGGNHSNHVHPMGWFSSALYIALPDDLGKDQAGWLTMGGPQAQLGIDLPYLRVVEPKAGRLALFPSTMWHGTKPFQDGERITVAFDVALNQ